MAKCKYPNEVCANMTMLNGTAYCDSVPCSLKDEVPKKTNADKIRAMTDEELAGFLHDYVNHTCSYCKECKSSCTKQNLEWLQFEAE